MLMIDDIDMKIVEELAKNARIRFKDLAKKIGLSDVATMKRVRSLEKSGVLIKYTTIFNPASIGYSTISYTGINVKPERLIDVINKLKEKSCVKYLAVTSGDHDIIAVIWARDYEELVRIHEEIGGIDGVVSVYPSIIAKIVKNEVYY